MGKALPTDDFTTGLLHYKRLIDDDIDSYTSYLEQVTREKYGTHAHTAVDAYLQILKRGGKRIRGALVMLGYEMSGGKDRAMIIQAARSIEMLHAYMLVIDDIQDRSPVRRGGPTAHKHLEAHHITSKFPGDAEHFGRAVAINGALVGLHAAERILSHLDADPQLKLDVIDIVNRTMMVTVHGQSHDITNELLEDVSLDDIESVMEWKTATYSILNPLHVGMVLAGADSQTIEGITEYAIHTGKAFQITDDIIGTFGKEADTHKNPMDDIREGKRTMLVVYALGHARLPDRQFLLSCLGNETLTIDDFERCKAVISTSGALDYAKGRADEHVTKALASLEKESHCWTPEGVAFLRGLSTYILGRNS